MGDKNAGYRIKPEAAIKFFVGVSSAGIGLIAALAEKGIATPGPTLGPIAWFASGSVAFFVLCILRALLFYLDATRMDQRNPLFQEHVVLCATFCSSGVVCLALAAVFGLLGVGQGTALVIILFLLALGWVIRRIVAAKRAAKGKRPEAK